MDLDKDDIYKAVLENFDEGIIIINQDNNIIFVNNAAENIRHIQKEKVLNKSILLCHPVKSQEKVKRAFDYLKMKEKGAFVRMVEDKSINKIYENSYSPILGPTGYLGSFVVSRDITKRRELEEQQSNYVKKLEEAVEDLTSKNQELFISSLTSLISALEAKDEYTKGHSMRVCDIVLKIIEHSFDIRMNKKELEIAAQLHDIGKVGVREEILRKPDRLTDEEYGEIKEHCTIAEKILAPITKLKSIIKIIRYHHERYDGKGYPDKLKGDEIPDGSKIMAIADSFDAMTSNRPYRKSMGPESAAREIERNLGTQFDPKWGGFFLDLFKTGSI